MAERPFGDRIIGGEVLDRLVCQSALNFGSDAHLMNAIMRDR
jgi:hypothetical protein